MKFASILIAIIGLMLTVSSSVIGPASSSPRALGDGTVNVTHDIPTSNNSSTSFHNDQNDVDLNPNVAVIGPSWIGDSDKCKSCANAIIDCNTDCKGGNRQSCDDYCNCEGLLSASCQLRGTCQLIRLQPWIP